MNRKVLYVPLDERNCNYGFPYQLGRIAGLDILRPPEEIMSRIKQPCDHDRLWDWLIENIKKCKYAILSLDMLVYGSLLNSRHHTMSQEECIKRLKRLKQLKQLNREAEIYAFLLIMRTANYDNNSEEPYYWAEYGTRIWRYSWLSDKKIKAGLDNSEEKELLKLKESIPQEHIRDYTDRRKINLQVNLETLNLVEEGTIDYLVIPKDDNSEYGFSAQDQEIIYGMIAEKGLRNKVYVYPGTDEVGCTLVSRILNKVTGRIPKVYVYYSTTLGPSIIAKYEDRPINESVKWQVVSAGAIMVDNYADADIILMVNTPGKYMLECAEQYKRDYSYINFRNLEDFIKSLEYFISLGKKCIIADIAYCNGADNELMGLLINGRLLDKIFGYGAWNTAANTLGVVILQGIVALSIGSGSISDNRNLFEFYVGKIIEDWAYQANVLLHLACEFRNEPGCDPYRLGDNRNQIAGEIVKRLNEYIKRNLAGYLPIRDITLKGVELKWDRVFDVEFNTEFIY